MSEPAAERDDHLEPVRWGVLGNARVFRRRFLPALLATPSATLAAVASRDEIRADEVEVDVPWHDSYEALLDDKRVEAVYIPLPNVMHAEWTLRSLEAGKHVLCEKPLAVDADDARRMVDAAHAADLRLAEAFQYRYHPFWAQIEALLAGGEIGDLASIDAVFSFELDRTSPNIRLDPALGGGVLWDLGAYCVHAARRIAGTEPLAATGRVLTLTDAGVDLTFEGTLGFEDGMTAHVATSFDRPFESRIVVEGSAGTMTIDKAFQAGPDSRAEIERPEGRLVVEGHGPVAYNYQLDAVNHAIRAGTPCWTEGDDAVHNARAIEALHHAAGV